MRSVGKPVPASLDRSVKFREGSLFRNTNPSCATCSFGIIRRVSDDMWSFFWSNIGRSQIRYSTAEIYDWMGGGWITKLAVELY